MAQTLADLLRGEIAVRFAERNPILGTADTVATFINPSQSIGDVQITTEGDEGVIVEITDMTHGHFDAGDPAEMVEACCRFLEDLFRDDVVVWAALGGGGGWFYPAHSDFEIPHGSRAGTWSGQQRSA